MAKVARGVAREDPRIRKAQILDIAIGIIGQRGYYGFTIQDLAEHCGLSNAGLLYHFGSKDQLLVALLQRLEDLEVEVMAPRVDAARRAIESGGPAIDAVMEVFTTILARAAQRPELGRLQTILQAESLYPDHPAHAAIHQREELVLALFAMLAAPFVGAPHIAARRLLAMMDGLTQQWLRAGQSFDLVGEWDAVVRLFLSDGKGRIDQRAATGPQAVAE